MIYTDKLLNDFVEANFKRLDELASIKLKKTMNSFNRETLSLQQYVLKRLRTPVHLLDYLVTFRCSKTQTIELNQHTFTCFSDHLIKKMRSPTFTNVNESRKVSATDAQVYFKY